MAFNSEIYITTTPYPWGVLQPLIEDETVAQILVEGFGKPSIYRKSNHRSGRTFDPWFGNAFEDEGAFITCIQALFPDTPLNTNSPTASLTLEDGTQITAALPPVARDGPMLMIRKPSRRTMTPLATAENLADTTQSAALTFLYACVWARLTICITGVNPDDCSHWLEVLSALIPSDERIAVVEAQPSLHLPQPHVISLTPRAANREGAGAVPISRVLNAVWDLRVDRAIIDPLVDPVATMDTLIRYSGAYEGGLFTVPAASPRAALSLLEVQFLAAGYDTPDRVARRYVSEAINVIVYIDQRGDLAQVVEVRGMEGDRIALTPLFEGDYAFRPTGNLPGCMRDIESAGIMLAPALFGIRDPDSKKRPTSRLQALATQIRRGFRHSRREISAPEPLQFDTVVDALRSYYEPRAVSALDSEQQAAKARQAAFEKRLIQRFVEVWYTSNLNVSPHYPDRRALSTEADEIRALFDSVLAQEKTGLSEADRDRLYERVLAAVIGYGPLQALIEDDTVSEIMVNAPDQVYIEVRGILKLLPDVTFEDSDQLLRIMDRITAPLGQRFDVTAPIVSTRLSDGSRVQLIMPPISPSPMIVIRKFNKRPLQIEDLIRFGALPPEVAEFLRALTIAGANILFSGNAGSGKLTLMQVTASFIPMDRRIITAESAVEMQLPLEHVLTLESRSPNIEGQGMVTVGDLIAIALQHRPDGIILGEIGMNEALAYIQAANTADLIVWTTITAFNPRDALNRLESLILMRNALPPALVRSRIASGLQFVVQQDRLRDGSRKVTAISEVCGVTGDRVELVDIFRFEETGYESGRIIGRTAPTGVIPQFYRAIFQTGITLPRETFGVSDAQMRAFIGDDQLRRLESYQQREAERRAAEQREKDRQLKEKQRAARKKPAAKSVPKARPLIDELELDDDFGSLDDDDDIFASE